MSSGNGTRPWYGKRQYSGGYTGRKKFKTGQTIQQVVGTMAELSGTGTKDTYSSKGNVQKHIHKHVGKIVIKPEKKYYDFGISHVNINQNYSGYGSEWYDLLNGITTGTDSGDRVGKVIQMCSIQMRLYVTNGASQTVGVPQVYRILLWIDTQNNGTATDVGTILDGAGSGTNCIINPYLLSNRGRFKILWDHTDTLDPGSNTSNFEQFYEKINQQVVYNASGTTVDKIQKGSLYLQIVSDGFLTVSGKARVRFYDS